MVTARNRSRSRSNSNRATDEDNSIRTQAMAAINTGHTIDSVAIFESKLAVRTCEMRRARYIGRKKLRLQAFLTTTAMNVLRGCEWLMRGNMPQRLFLASPSWLLLRNMRLPPSSWQFANNILVGLYQLPAHPQLMPI